VIDILKEIFYRDDSFTKRARTLYRIQAAIAEASHIDEGGINGNRSIKDSGTLKCLLDPVASTMSDIDK
jgi:hypothetical protein